MKTRSGLRCFIMICCIFSLSFMGLVNAEGTMEMGSRLLSETVINELELVEELKSMDDAELVDMGFTELEVKTGG